jgi:hypothetical protein
MEFSNRNLVAISPFPFPGIGLSSALRKVNRKTTYIQNVPKEMSPFWITVTVEQKFLSHKIDAWEIYLQNILQTVVSTTVLWFDQSDGFFPPFSTVTILWNWNACHRRLHTPLILSCTVFLDLKRYHKRHAANTWQVSMAFRNYNGSHI